MAFALLVGLVFLLGFVQGSAGECANSAYNLTAICETGCKCACKESSALILGNPCLTWCTTIYSSDSTCDFANGLTGAPGDPYPYCDEAAEQQLCEDRCHCCGTTDFNTCVTNCKNALVPFIGKTLCVNQSG